MPAPKKTVKIILIVLLLALIIVSAGFAVFGQNNNSSSPSVKLNVNPFEKYSYSSYQKYTAELEKIFSKNSTYFQNWNWNENMILGDFLKYDKNLNQISLYVDLPYNQSFSKNTLLTYNGCLPEETIVVDSPTYPTDVVKANINIADYLSKGDVVAAFCNEPECINLKSPCVIIKR